MGRRAKFRKPRANPPFCWICDRMLYAGGRAYVTIAGEDGHEHPAHRECARDDGCEVLDD